MAFSQLQPLCLVLQTILIHILYLNLLSVISYIKVMYPARLINQTLVHMLHYSPSFLLIFPVTFIYHIFCLELYYLNLTNKFPIHFHPKFSKIFHISLLPASNYRITYIPTYLGLELIVTCMFKLISIKTCNTIMKSSFSHTHLTPLNIHKIQSHNPTTHSSEVLTKFKLYY